MFDNFEINIERAAAHDANVSEGAMPGRIAQSAGFKICHPVLDRCRRRRKGLPRTKLGRRVLYSQVWLSSCEHRDDAP
jgi:hypothetical protein